jgi:hypothetical protein
VTRRSSNCRPASYFNRHTLVHLLQKHVEHSAPINDATYHGQLQHQHPRAEQSFAASREAKLSGVQRHCGGCWLEAVSYVSAWRDQKSKDSIRREEMSAVLEYESFRLASVENLVGGRAREIRHQPLAVLAYVDLFFFSIRHKSVCRT